MIGLHAKGLIPKDEALLFAFASAMIGLWNPWLASSFRQTSFDVVLLSEKLFLS
jgi:hypothetical protein